MGETDVVFVGRDRELDALERLLEATRQGRAGAVFVSGEPGTGKTHLLAALMRQAEGHGCLVLDGRAAEFERGLPFGVIIDALDAYVQSLHRSTLDRLAADGLQELADVLPSLRTLRPASSRTSTLAERFRIYYSVRELLERLAAQQPLVLVLDDLHWADDASLELVAHLLRRSPDAPVLLAAAFRTGQAPSTLRIAIDAAQRTGDVESIELGPLPEAEAGRLLAPGDQKRRTDLYRLSGGNPFYLLQLARAGGGGEHAPAAVTAAIAHELLGLSADARRFAEAAAVVGDPFDLQLAAATAGVDEASALASVDELIARDLMRPSEVPRRFHFRHPLVRTAIYAAAPTSSRLVAHARCTEALGALGAPAATRAHHFEQSARVGDQAAIDVLLEAGRATTHQIPGVAAGWFLAALRLLPPAVSAYERVACSVRPRTRWRRAAACPKLGRP